MSEHSIEIKNVIAICFKSKKNHMEIKLNSNVNASAMIKLLQS